MKFFEVSIIANNPHYYDFSIDSIGIYETIDKIQINPCCEYYDFDLEFKDDIIEIQNDKKFINFIITERTLNKHDTCNIYTFDSSEAEPCDFSFPGTEIFSGSYNDLKTFVERHKVITELERRIFGTVNNMIGRCF